MALLAAGLLLLVAGCGDSAKSNQGPEEIHVEGDASVTKAEYIKEADAVCLAATKRVTRAGEELGRKLVAAGATNAEAQLKLPAHVKETMVPLYEEELGQVSALGVPAGDEKEVTEILRTLQKGVEKLDREPQTVFSGNSSLNEASRLGHEYGFDYCGSLA